MWHFAAAQIHIMGLPPHHRVEQEALPVEAMAFLRLSPVTGERSAPERSAEL